MIDSWPLSLSVEAIEVRSSVLTVNQHTRALLSIDTDSRSARGSYPVSVPTVAGLRLLVNGADSYHLRSTFEVVVACPYRYLVDPRPFSTVGTDGW